MKQGKKIEIEVEEMVEGTILILRTKGKVRTCTGNESIGRTVKNWLRCSK